MPGRGGGWSFPAACTLRLQRSNRSATIKQVLDERQLTSDEAVLDIYPRADETRMANSRGQLRLLMSRREKKPIAFENFRALVDLLQRNATHAVFDDGYVRMRIALNKVWPLESGAGYSERRRTLTRDVNALRLQRQRTSIHKYSRLLRFLCRSCKTMHGNRKHQASSGGRTTEIFGVNPVIEALRARRRL